MAAAHQGPIFCIRWHLEDKNLLASGGRDRLIQVWDLNEKNEKFQAKPLHAIEATLGLARIEWRPDHRSHILSAQIMDPKIHLWYSN